MSVSFYAQAPVTGWEIACACGETRVGGYASHAAGIAAYGAGVRAVCADEYCTAYARMSVVPQATAADAFDLNMSNVNARGVLDVLGFGGEDDDLSGSVTADDLLGRVLLAQAIAPADEGTLTFQEGNVVHCGRPAGYLQDRLAQIGALAGFAQTHGYTVTWS